MTNAEKFILKEKDAKETVIALLSLFNGKNYKFANAALNTAKMFLNEESQFQAANALMKINSLVQKENPAPVTSPKKKTITDLEGGEKILSAVKAEVKYHEIFSTLLKDAKVKSYVGEELTLKFNSEYKANFFEEHYKVRFENTTSKLFGKQITATAEF